jgi:hypothetical protein
MLEARDGELVRIDLDDPEHAEDNDATVRTIWERAAPQLQLGARFVDEAVAGAAGNPQHAVTLRKHLAGLPVAQRRFESIPRGLAALLVKLWERIAADPVTVVGLGILCASREPLTLDEVAAVAGWTDDARRLAFARAATMRSPSTACTTMRSARTSHRRSAPQCSEVIMPRSRASSRPGRPLAIRRCAAMPCAMR